MKVSIIFHSVFGNTYLLGKEIYQKCIARGVDVKIYRVSDNDLEQLKDNYPIVNEHLDEIIEVPIVNLDEILESDYIFLGSPTYFGNVSGEMKSFMDSFSRFWVDAKFFGKKLVSFTTCGTPEGGGESCLKAINIFGQHLGMINIPIPSNLVPGKSNSAYGLVHYTSGKGNIRPGEDAKEAIDSLMKILIDKDI